MEDGCKTWCELAQEYGVHVTTLRQKINPFMILLKTDKKRMRVFYPNQYNLVYERLGKPKKR